jgi:hypothetical protein
MKPRTTIERSERRVQIEELYRAAGTPITPDQSAELADREYAENAADYLKLQRLDDYLPETARKENQCD